MIALVHSVLALSAFLGSTVQAQGFYQIPFGFAAGTTGGGDATPAAPADTTQLAEWLADDVPRVILIDREFSFLGDLCVDCSCCIPASNTCGNAGQNAIDVDIGWCGDSPKVTCTYDQASSLYVGSNKSVVGVGNAAVIRGNGLRLTNNVSNIIIQNIHITDLNPELIWGGDAISIDGADMVWIDHVKFSLIGRQMLVTGFGPSGRVTVSNCEFDGQTSWSASCDGHHYWTILALGNNDKVTFANNLIHHTSGRSPKIGGPSFWHVFNNYWYDDPGHAFDVSEEANVLVEGNFFEDVNNAYNGEGAGSIFVVEPDNEPLCSYALGRSCGPNILSNSTATSVADDAVFSNYPTDEGITSILPAEQVVSYVLAHAGVGKLGSDNASSVHPVLSPAPFQSASVSTPGSILFVPTPTPSSTPTSSVLSSFSSAFSSTASPTPTYAPPSVCAASGQHRPHHKHVHGH